jgi:hypothetical protein
MSPVVLKNVSPVGRVPEVSVSVDTGKPLPVSAKVPPVPTVNVAVVELSAHPLTQVPVIVVGATGVGGVTVPPVPPVVGGKATTKSLNCRIVPPIDGSTAPVASKKDVTSNSNWQEYVWGVEPISIGVPQIVPNAAVGVKGKSGSSYKRGKLPVYVGEGGRFVLLFQLIRSATALT